MKRVLLFLAILLSATISYSQDFVFMSILENKMLCKEDRLVNFLETNSFVRNHRSFHREYSYNREQYYTDIAYDNECYAIYRTNNIKEYNSIKARVMELCSKETEPNKSVYYACNVHRIYGIQIILSGYLSAESTYEIKIYQNPGWEENSYPLNNK